MTMRFLICFSFLFLGCLQPEKEIVDYIIPLAIDDANDIKSFEHIGSIVADRDIVILGESDHGDGKTIELKSRLVKYLIEEKGFNTFAGEGVGFFDMEILNENPSKITIPQNFLKNIWALSWGYSEPLISTLEKNQVKYIGIESDSYLLSQSPEMRMKYLKKNLNVSDRTKFAGILKEMEETFLKISSLSAAKVSENEIGLYIQNLEMIKANINGQNNTDENKSELLTKVIENMVSFAEYFKYFNIIGTYKAQNIAINLRDEQMAKNLIWYKERHKDAKIIVWTANFHGAKKIREIRYKEEEPDLYNDFILFGEHLHNEYGSDVYSIAFTSATGETSTPFGERTKTIKIDAERGTLENKLYEKRLEYGFLDFSAIRKSYPGLIDKVFSAKILGHDNKPGKWLQVFDGVFFLRTESPLSHQ